MRKPAKHKVLSVSSALLGSLTALVSYVAARLRLSIPKTNGKIELPCLEDEVEILYDGAGIPHIYAKNNLDGFRALGFAMAQDRMVQMHLMLMVARGELASLTGKMALDMDRFMRTIGLSRTSKELAKALEEETRERVEAFCDGINSYLATSSMKLPLEFLILGGKPEPWTPEDCLTMGLFMGWELDSMWLADLTREKLLQALGESASELLPETADCNNPPVKVKGPGCDATTLEPGEEIDWGFDRECGGGELLQGIRKVALGSNNWVLGCSRTVEGKPILAADPHIQHNVPGMMYLCHLSTPEVDAIGAAFAGLPVVAFGHNGFCGWAATSLCPDTQDLYVETFESEQSDRYLFDGEWEEAQVIEEQVKVRFSKTRTVKVLVTRHGPVIKRIGNKGLALKWVSHDLLLDSMGAMFSQNKAHSWDEFIGSMKNFVGPAMSQVYADVEGNIGYFAATKVPKRKKGDGTIPYDGRDPSSEWDGYVPFERMPMMLNPKEDFMVTANSKIVSEGYPEFITRSWEAPYRNARITQLLKGKKKWAAREMREVHADTFTFPGRHYSEALLAAASDESRASGLSPLAKKALEIVKGWDHFAKADSPAMCIYFFSWAHLRRLLLEHRLGSSLYDDYIHTWTTVNLAVENILDGRDPFWLPPGYRTYEDVVIKSLELGIEELAEIFGNQQVESWEWGRIHHLTCRHLAGVAWPLDKLLNVGPVPRDGEGDTVNASPPSSDCLTQLLARGTMGGVSSMPILPDPQSHEAYAGPVLRLVIDFSNLDESLVVLDVGQSGHRLSPHYKDHFGRWQKVEYFPLPYSRAKVEEFSGERLVLAPKKRA